jgi:FAD/FMN-containing dehydrogenase
MKRRKDPIAIEVMRAIKKALDPKNLMNPGKVLPEI